MLLDLISGPNMPHRYPSIHGWLSYFTDSDQDRIMNQSERNDEEEISRSRSLGKERLEKQDHMSRDILELKKQLNTQEKNTSKEQVETTAI